MLDKQRFKLTGLILATTVLGITLALTLTACDATPSEPQPYEYVHTTETKPLVIYENERIRDAERSPVVSMAQLGLGDLTLGGGEATATPTVEYTLPEGAAQGPDTWYIINFHFIIEFSDNTGVGSCNVRADPGASVQFETLRVNASPYIRVGGRSSDSTRMDVRYYSYLPQSTVAPGSNEMTFEFTEHQGARVKGVNILSDTAIETTAVSPQPPQTGAAPVPKAREPFYGVSPELEARLRQICLADPRVAELVKGSSHSFVIDGQTITNEDYNLAVGVRLQEGIGPEQLRQWLDAGREDADIIREYVGVLHTGENEVYHIVIDPEQGAVSELAAEERTGTGIIPQVSSAEKQRAVEIALADATVQAILADKEYEIAPDSRIGVWHSGATKLGVAFEISFDRPYQISAELPGYQRGSYRYSGEAAGLRINVLLDEERVAEITPAPPRPGR